MSETTYFPFRSPARCVPLSLDGEGCRRGLLLYVIDHKMAEVFCAGLKWVLSYKPAVAKSSIRDKPESNIKLQHIDFTVNPPNKRAMFRPSSILTSGSRHCGNCADAS